MEILLVKWSVQVPFLPLWMREGPCRLFPLDPFTQQPDGLLGLVKAHSWEFKSWWEKTKLALAGRTHSCTSALFTDPRPRPPTICIHSVSSHIISFSLDLADLIFVVFNLQILTDSPSSYRFINWSYWTMISRLKKKSPKPHIQLYKPLKELRQQVPPTLDKQKEWNTNKVAANLPQNFQKSL